MATTEKKQSNQIQWDVIRSTYWWKIECDPSHTDNSPLGRTIYGFSKADGHDERSDKEMLLMKKIQMLASQGYVGRCIRIEIYWKRGEMINKATDPLLITLFPTDFKLESQLLKPKYDTVRDFLRNMYALLKEGKSVRYLLPKGKPEFSKDDWFEIKNLWFTDLHQLDNYCSKLIKNKHSFERVIKFRADFIEKKGFAFKKEGQ